MPRRHPRRRRLRWFLAVLAFLDHQHAVLHRVGRIGDGNAPAAQCGQLLAQSTPTVTPGPAPELSALEGRLPAALSRSFTFAGQTCVATATPAQTITLSGTARLRPTLAIDGHENLGGRQVEVRFVGPRIYIYLPEIAAGDGGKPWLSADLKTISSASGLDFGQLLAEVQQLSPSRRSPLLSAAAAFKALGRATLDGHAVYAYRASFTPATITSAGLPAKLAAQTASRLRQLGATREVVTTFLEPSGVGVRTVSAIDKGGRLLTVGVNGSAPSAHAVVVTAPPAAKTIPYDKVAGTG